MKNNFILFSMLLLSSCVNNNDVKAPVAPVVAPPLKTSYELAKLLPVKMNDYSASMTPKGVNMKLQNAAFSFTTQKYIKGNDTIYVELHDYRDDKTAYSHYAKMWWESNDEVNNEMKVSKFISFGPNVSAWEVWERDDNKRSAIYVGVKNRYYLTFECFGRDNTDFIRDIAAKFDYTSL